jgi:Rrf2 family protein
MKINTKIRYGFRAMVEIAQNTNPKGIFQKEISKNQGISNKYLDHIMHALKVSGLIIKAGHKGGYMLSRNASEITLFDVYKSFEPGISVIDCLACNLQCPLEIDCSTRDFWYNLNVMIVDHFQSHTLQDLVDRQIKINSGSAI